MDAEAKDRRRERFEAHCRAQGLPLTVQRRTIFGLLPERDDHPTVDEIFDSARRRIPGLSRATVHRTLETLVQSGLLAKATVPGRATRYDTRLERHHHLICSGCDAVIDICDPSLDALNVPDVTHLGFEVRDVVVQIRGLCRTCRTGEPGHERSNGKASPRRERR